MRKRKKEKIYVLCVFGYMEHDKRAVSTRCCKCSVSLWVQPWNLHLDHICIDCMRAIGTSTFGVRSQDLEAAAKYIKEEKNANKKNRVEDRSIHEADQKGSGERPA